MKKSESKTKIIAIVCTLLFFFSLGGAVYLHDSNQSLEQLLKGSKLTSETLLSQKLILEKEIAQMKGNIQKEMGMSVAKDKLLAQANTALTKKEKEIKSLKNKKSVDQKFAELQKIKSDLDGQVAEMNARIKGLESEKNTLTSQLADANSKSKEMASNMALMKQMGLNNYEVEATKKNQKLTVVARKTRNLNLAFDLPAGIAENVQFKIKTPSGKVIDKTDPSLAYGLDTYEGLLTASVEPIELGIEVSKRITMSYKPKEKLSRGLYVIEILNGETHMASCQVKLK
ncbi:hypothetical protein G3O08_15255 [Cryomorpha ignava]|uniref:Uncharacterized protein n=1 Tax=Cryomorpha ignava TaxID=101383 RepID=A0A7K3WT40_9FLAO|nr:hypothetical protein [Cryomorpha ignava]NEN24859.1 hypothetical protein [Cryomorpha ignava]